MPNTVYDEPLCNMCWEVIEEPFIITLCNHAFCRQHYPHIVQESKCPGCGLLLNVKNDVRMARLRVSAEEITALVGLRPDVVRDLAMHAREFWNVQECVRSDYLAHKCSETMLAADEQKQSFESAHQSLAQHLLAARQRLQNAVTLGDKLEH